MQGNLFYRCYYKERKIKYTQSILLSLSKNDGGEETLSATGVAMPALGVANELEPISDDDLNTPVDLLDDDLNLSEELDLIDEEF